MNRTWAQSHIDDAEPISQAEGVRLLRVLLAEAARDASRLDDAIVDAAVLTLGALDGVDHSEDATADIVAELNANGTRVEALNELLRRMVDREADDRLLTIPAVEASLEAVEQSLVSLPAPPPLPEPTDAMGSGIGPLTSPGRRRLALAGLVALPFLLALMLAVRVGSEVGERDRPSFERTVAGSTVEAWGAERLDDAGVDWATDAIDATSRFDLLEYVRYAPDVFPEYPPEDYDVWRASHPDGGLEWVLVRWPSPRPALGVVVAETFGAGAIVAVDDALDSHTSTVSTGSFDRLWAGTTQGQPGEATVILLAQPRTIGGVRVVLDTSRVPGPNHIDAIGLLTKLPRQ